MSLFEDFLIKARAKHGNKFDYSKLEYKNALTKGVIICSIHGEFEQTPSCHLQSNTGCPKCTKELSKLKFFEDANLKYDYKYDYSKFKYTTEKDKSVIVCPIHGEFEDTPRNHLNGSESCHKCKEKQLKDEFFKKANERYNYYFDYSKFKYINAKTKSIIICPVHGEFEQTPDKHLQGINPCPECETEAKILRNQNKSESHCLKISEGKKKDIADFLEKAFLKFGDKFEYDFTNYTGLTGNSIRVNCPIHGWFEKQPHNFLVTGHGCTECGLKSKYMAKTKSYESFVIEAQALHNGKYTYPERNVDTFENRNSIVEIECKEHGVFKKRASKHLSGQGCFKCKILELIENGLLPGGYNAKLFRTNRDIANKKGYLYYLKVNNGQYYKIGITVNLQRRLNSLSSKLGNIEVLQTRKTTLENAYYTEQLILSMYRQVRVSTDKSTELFSVDISKDSSFDNLFN